MEGTITSPPEGPRPEDVDSFDPGGVPISTTTPPRCAQEAPETRCEHAAGPAGGGARALLEQQVLTEHEPWAACVWGQAGGCERSPRRVRLTVQRTKRLEEPRLTDGLERVHTLDRQVTDDRRQTRRWQGTQINRHTDIASMSFHIRIL